MKEIVIDGKPTMVGKSIGKGGEGEVFEIKGNSGLVVKIYNPKLRSAREDKVCAMVKEGLASKTELIAYPSDIAFDKHGSFVGFLMRLVSGYRPIHELYSPKSRQTHFQKADYRFIIRSALNVARAIANSIRIAIAFLTALINELFNIIHLGAVSLGRRSHAFRWH